MLQRMLIATFFFAMLSGCQTSMLHSFEKIHPGMDKAAVLDIVGSPDANTRMHGKDRWIYNFYEDKIHFEKEIHFADGNVIYVGDAWNPGTDKTAHQTDKKNQEVEANLQAEEKAREELRRNNAKLFREYEESAHNKDKVRYSPAFVDVK